MENRLWHKVDDKTGVVLVLTGDKLYRFGFTGNNARQEATEAVTALSGGQEPSSLVATAPKVLPLTSIQRVEVSHDRDTVRFHTIEAGQPVMTEFTIKSGDDAPAIARAVVDRAGISHPERSEDVSAVEALLGPVILGVIAGVLWTILYVIATSVDNGEEINANRGGRGRGLKQLFLFVANLLGTNGTIAVGVILLIAFLGWAIKLIVKRPQRLVWGPPATA